MFRNLIVIILFNVSFLTFSQDDTTRLNFISTELDLEMFDGQYTFAVDAIISIDSIHIYSVTPFLNSYSYCFIFKGDSSITIPDFIDSGNRLPYEFELIETLDGRAFIKTFSHLEGTIFSKLTVHILELTNNNPKEIYSGLISKVDKEFPDMTSYNCFDFIIIGEFITVTKKSNCADSLIEFNRAHNANIEVFPLLMEESNVEYIEL